MSRRFVPDPDAILTALAGRLDALERRMQLSEERMATIGQDIAALGRGVAHLTAEIRRLGAEDADEGEAVIGVEAAEEESLAGQLDWLAIEDVETARLLLPELAAWTAEVLPHHGLHVTAPCWPLHPQVVTVLFALHAERGSAYAGPSPTPVTEWLTRWLPAATSRIDASLAECAVERGHVEDGRTHDARDLDLASVAAWWVTDRATPPATALSLSIL